VKTVALTGATGFVGRITLERLVSAGWHVRALTRRDQTKKPDVTWVHGHLGDTASLAELCKGADAVLHVAGVVNAPDAAGFESGNVTGTANMLTAAQSAGIERFVSVSSLAARHPDLSMYGASKARAEYLVRGSKLSWTIIRPPGVYGPGDTEMFDMFRIAAKGWALLPPRGRVSVIHVDDLARLLVSLLSADDVSKRVYEADDGTPGGWSHDGFAKAIGAAVGRNITTIHAPAFLLKIAGWADRAVRGHKAKLTPDRASYLAHPDWTVDPEAAPTPALWKPEIATPAGLRDTVKWYRKQGWM
jgi:nucleoside-diphosphate-sugar epimerase